MAKYVSDTVSHDYKFEIINRLSDFISDSDLSPTDHFTKKKITSAVVWKSNIYTSLKDRGKLPWVYIHVFLHSVLHNISPLVWAEWWSAPADSLFCD